MIQRLSLNRLCSAVQLRCRLILQFGVDHKDFCGKEILFGPFLPITIYKLQQVYFCFSKLLILLRWWGFFFTLNYCKGKKKHFALLKIIIVSRLVMSSGSSGSCIFPELNQYFHFSILILGLFFFFFIK